MLSVLEFFPLAVSLQEFAKKKKKSSTRAVAVGGYFFQESWLAGYVFQNHLTPPLQKSNGSPLAVITVRPTGKISRACRDNR